MWFWPQSAIYSKSDSWTLICAGKSNPLNLDESDQKKKFFFCTPPMKNPSLMMVERSALDHIYFLFAILFLVLGSFE